MDIGTRTQLRALIVEDSDDDTVLLLKLLTDGGYDVTHSRVESAEAMHKALDGVEWDVIISDHRMPRFDALAALEIRGRLAPDTPFIVLSGSIGEEAAVQAMRSGADDYVMKHRAARLVPAVRRELLDASARLARRRAEAALSESEGLNKVILESSLDAIVIIDREGRLVDFNPAAEATFGYERSRVIGQPMSDLIIPPRWREAHEQRFARFLATGVPHVVGTRIEIEAMRADGSEIPIELGIAVVRRGAEPLFAGFIRDLSGRRRAEESLRRFRVAMDNSVDMFLLIDRKSMRYIDFNPAACRLLGYTRQELLGLGPQDVMPFTRAQLEKSYDELIADPTVKGGVNSYYLCKDGSRLPFESTRHVLRSGDSWIIAAISRDIRERQAIERTMRESETRFRRTFELAASGMAHVGRDHRFLRVNRRLCEMFGYAEQELIGRSVRDLSHPEDAALADLPRAQVHAGELASARVEKRYLRKDGSVLWVNLTVSLIADDEGRPEYDIAVFEDITERREADEKIRHLNRVYAVLSGINAAIVRIHDRAELFREACRIAVSAGGFSVARIVEIDEAGKAAVAASIEEDPAVFSLIVEEYNRDPAGADSLLARAIRGGEPIVSNDVAGDARIRIRSPLAGKVSYALALLPLVVQGRMAGVMVLRSQEAGMFDAEEMKLLTEMAGDIAFAMDHIEKEKRLDYLAYYDALTGLANRSLFVERLNQAIHAAGQAGAKVAVGICDIERLRTVNETLGRQGGDSLLKQVAERHSRAAGRAETARFSADQFVTMVSGVKGRSETARIAQIIANKCFAEPFVVEGHELRVSSKTGIAMFPADGIDAETLLKHAEAALRKGKRTGEVHTFFSPDLVEDTAETLTLENKLRQALEKNEFVLHYQPKVDAATRRIVGVEALIRWMSPELGLVPPMQFIPLMEETGIILQVGPWALSQAVADHRRWVEMQLAAPRVAVNVSAIQLRRQDFLDTLRAAVAGGAVPMGLDLELTESLVMEDIDGTIRKLHEARKLGASIAVDDFGTGYSSLAYLARLPVQTLKIDRSFVITMLKDPDTMALVQTIISLAHSLRLKVVAEGVDDEEQAKVLQLLRCDEMQGYLYSRPLPFDEMTELLRSQA